jgi:hypothetical protein
MTKNEMKNIFLVLLILTLIISCSHKPKQPKHKEFFVTHILADGTKMFSYNLILEGPQGSDKKGRRGGGESKGRGAGGSGSGGKMGKGGDRGKKDSLNRPASKQKINKRFYANLENILHKNNYCREGYVELNSFIDREGAEMKGQCHEKANKVDRVKFINQ